MTMKKRTITSLLTATLIFLAITTALMIYISNFKNVAFDIGHYETQYEKLNVYERFPEGTNLTYQTQVLLDYLAYENDSIDTGFYNAKEQAHMIEVRGLFDRLFRFLDVTVVLSVLLVIGFMFLVRKIEMHMNDKESRKHFKDRLSQLLTWIGYAVLGIAGLFVLVGLTFDYSFIWFHKIFFDTNTWMMNATVDNMVRMLPFNFFLNTFVNVIMMSVGYAAVLFVLGLFVGKEWKHK